MSSHKTQKLFIGGAGKSGTTFLFSCLGQHPEIIPAEPKEPSFFLDQEHPLLNSKNNIHQNGNHNLFFPNQHGIHLDASVHLLYQREMPSLFAEIKNSKLIFILRHPAERIYSSFQFVKHNLAHFKKEVSFSEYVEALLDEKVTLIQSWLRTRGSQYVLARELEISTYEQHIQKWEKAIGEDRIYLLTFRELTKE
ncbi:MAG: sulfotransferase domain-containing protein, partial [Bacteroidota bacterium]